MGFIGYFIDIVLTIPSFMYQSLLILDDLPIIIDGIQPNNDIFQSGKWVPFPNSLVAYVKYEK